MIHPDSHELHDWPDYGPQNPEIGALVRRLALNYGMRLTDIERLILDALRGHLQELEAEGNDCGSSSP